MASRWQAGQSKTYTDGPCHSPTCPSLRHVSIGVDRCWVHESGVWRTNPGRGLLLTARRQPEGTGVMNSATRNPCGGNQDHRRNKAPLLSDVQKVGPPMRSLSPYVPARAALREGVSFWNWLACPYHHLLAPPLLPGDLLHDHCFGSL